MEKKKIESFNIVPPPSESKINDEILKKWGKQGIHHYFKQINNEYKLLDNTYQELDQSIQKLLNNGK